MDTVIAGRRSQPLAKFRFRVLIEDFDPMGFTEVQGLRSEIPVLEVKEGGNLIPHKYPDSHQNSGNLLLVKGLVKRADLAKWYMEHLIYKKTNRPIFRSILVVLLSRSGRPEYAWEFFKCFPTILEHDGLDSSSDDIVIQRAEIANSGFEPRVSTSTRSITGNTSSEMAAQSALAAILRG